MQAGGTLTLPQPNSIARVDLLHSRKVLAYNCTTLQSTAAQKLYTPSTTCWGGKPKPQLTMQVAGCALHHDRQGAQALLHDLQRAWQSLNVPAQVQRERTLVAGSLRHTPNRREQAGTGQVSRCMCCAEVHCCLCSDTAKEQLSHASCAAACNCSSRHPHAGCCQLLLLLLLQHRLLVKW
jgi:hypothetical protein